MKSGTVTAQEEREIHHLFLSGLTIAEIAIQMDRGVGMVIRGMDRMKLIDQKEYEHLVEMPLEWVADWLAIYKRYGNHER